MEADTMTKITLDTLDENSVSIKTCTYVLIDGVQHLLNTHRCACVNSERGRVEIAEELSEPHISAVMALWGDAPTVHDDNIGDHNNA